MFTCCIYKGRMIMIKKINSDDINDVLNEILLESSNGCKSVLISTTVDINAGPYVINWLEEHKDLEYSEFLANCYPSVNKVACDDNDINKTNYIEFYFCDNEIDYFKESSILFIDHFDLTENDARKHLMRLVKNHEIKSGSDSEIVHIDDLKMIVATMYEIGSSYFGCTPLSDEDIESFDYVIEVK